MAKTKQQTKSLNAHELYLSLIDNFKWISKYWGFDIYCDEFKLNKMLVLTNLWTFACVINFLHLFVVNLSADPVDLFISIVFLGATVQQVAKVWNIFSNHEKLKQCHQVVLDLSKSSQGEAQEKIRQLNAFFHIFGKFILGLNMNATILLSVYPLYSYIRYGRKDYIIQFFLPFVNRETNGGHVILLLAQFSQVFNTAIQFFMTDSIFFYYLFFAGTYAELVEQDIRTLSDAISESKSMRDRRQPHVQGKLHTLLIKAFKRSQGMDDYFEKLKFFESLLLIQFGCLCYTLMLCMLIIKKSTWFAIYPVTVIVVFEITMYSVIGTYIEAKYDRLPIVVYDIPWYDLTPSDQKMLMVFLQHSQKPKKLSIIGASTLNVETGVAIFKFIYSAYIMIDSIY